MTAGTADRPARSGRGSRARRTLVGFAAVGALATSACAAGQQAQTADEKPTLDGTEANAGDIALRGLAIDTPPDGISYRKGSSALLTVSLSNSGTAADQLTSVTSSTIGGWAAYGKAADATQAQTLSGRPGGDGLLASLPKPTQSVSIPAGSATSFGLPTSTGGLLVSGLTGVVYPGTDVTFTFTFAKAGSVQVSVPVQLTSTPPTAVVSGTSSDDSN